MTAIGVPMLVWTLSIESIIDLGCCVAQWIVLCFDMKLAVPNTTLSQPSTMQRGYHVPVKAKDLSGR